MELLDTKMVKTRKPHMCWGCRHMIPAGSLAERQTCVDDTIYSVYTCAVCKSLIDSDPNFWGGCDQDLVSEGYVVEYFGFAQWGAESEKLKSESEASHGND